MSIKQLLAGTAAAAALLASPVQADDRTTGALIGASIGAVVGHQIDGRNGALIGGALGAVAGSQLAADRQDHRYRQRVAVQPVVTYQPVRHARVSYQPVVSYPAVVTYQPVKVKYKKFKPAKQAVVVYQPVHYGHPGRGPHWR